MELFQCSGIEGEKKKINANKGPRNLELKDEEELVSMELMSELCLLLLYVFSACKLPKILHIKIKRLVLLAGSSWICD